MKALSLLPSLLVSALSNAAGNAAADPAHAARMAASLELFRGEVRAVLIENCVKCHGGEKTRSEFDMTTRAGLLAGGDQGVAATAGEPAASPLLDYLRHREEPHMPPKKPQLPEAAIAAIEKWIELGAAYDKPLVESVVKEAGPMQVTEEDRAYWAFAPLHNDFGDKNSIGDFMESAAPASRRALARRLHFDLTGLPPDPDAIERFVGDRSPGAYGELVDHLLASPRFGEKWARHWLDVARFAESHGFEHDYDRKFAFHFRDFVIRAFNEDMPYKQFVRWQLAGDEIAPGKPLAMMATGFLGAGVYPTQITFSESERVRYDAMDDMLATVGSAMLATTIGCARCHDHKYDPIPTRDYYQMLSAFTATVRSNVELDLSLLDEDSAAEFAATQATLQAKLADYETVELPRAYGRWVESHRGEDEATEQPAWSVLKAKRLVSKGGAEFRELPDGSYLATGNSPDRDVYTFDASAPLSAATAIRLEAMAHESMVKGGPGRAGNGNIQLTGFELVADGEKVGLRNPRATFQQNGGSLSIASAIDSKANTGWALDPQFGKDHAAIFEIAEPEKISADAELTVVLRFAGNTRHTIGRPRLSLSGLPPNQLGFGGGENPRAAAERRLAELRRSPGNEDAILEQFKILDAGYQKIVAELAAHEASGKRRRQQVMVCADGRKYKPMRHHTNTGRVRDFLDETHFLSRGDPRQKGEAAPLGFLQVLSRGVAPVSSGRTALADWITEVESGAGHLLARVIVNRLWQHYFGEGIVATPNDFGFQGGRPSHPELLDWLAVQLIDSDWSLKHVHRLIVHSSAYRAQRAPRRLEAEAIRDSALAVAGLLDERMYGAGTLDEGMRRRSIYFMVKRSKLVPFMQLFDWPDTLTSLGMRAVTTTPSQALVFINDPQMRAMAEGFARRIAGVRDPVARAYRIAYGRHPSDRELAAGNAFIARQAESHGGDGHNALADFCGALMSANEFIYIE